MTKISYALLGAVNLVLAGSPAWSQPAPSTAVSHDGIEQANIATFKAIESTWLKVPNLCKAVTFHASPAPVEKRILSAAIQSIYSSFEA